jgi:hypothetical protein
MAMAELRLTFVENGGSSTIEPPPMLGVQTKYFGLRSSADILLNARICPELLIARALLEKLALGITPRFVTEYTILTDMSSARQACPRECRTKPMANASRVPLEASYLKEFPPIPSSDRTIGIVPRVATGQ